MTVPCEVVVVVIREVLKQVVRVVPGSSPTIIIVVVREIVIVVVDVVVRVTLGVRVGVNIRSVGEDLTVGERALKGVVEDLVEVRVSEVWDSGHWRRGGGRQGGERRRVRAVRTSVRAPLSLSLWAAREIRDRVGRRTVPRSTARGQSSTAG